MLHLIQQNIAMWRILAWGSTLIAKKTSTLVNIQGVQKVFERFKNLLEMIIHCYSAVSI